MLMTMTVVLATALPASPSADVWDALQQREELVPSPWAELFMVEEEPPSDAIVLAAFRDLMPVVTGEEGFWRLVVSEVWLGCGDKSRARRCKTVHKSLAELEIWSGLHEAILKVESGKAGEFLETHSEIMLEYLKTFAPVTRTGLAMQQTGFYRAGFGQVFQTLSR